MGFGYGRQHATAEQTEPFPRGWRSGRVVSEAIDLASERSPTFPKLVTTIDGTDGIVTSTSDNVDGRSCHACCWRSPRPGPIAPFTSWWIHEERGPPHGCRSRTS